MDKNFGLSITIHQSENTNKISEKSLDQLRSYMLDYAHPIGSYYWSSVSTNPHELFGGTWVQVQDKMIMAIGTTFLKDGGHATGKIKLSKDQLPEHYHDLSNHTHNMQHKHTRGSMNVYGEINYVSETFMGYGTCSGVFGKYTGHYAGQTPSSTDAQDTGGIYMDAANYWTGFTSDSCDINTPNGHDGQLGHTAPTTKYDTSGPSVNYTGKNYASEMKNNEIDIMPPYEVAYCWKRIPDPA